MEELQVVFPAESDLGEIPAEKLETAKPETSPKLSLAAGSLLERYHQEIAQRQARTAEPTIKVGGVLGSVAFAYERLRNLIDYKGEHLRRRQAIERILSRLLRERPDQTLTAISLSLVRELIWARYLANDSLPKSKADQVAQVLAKHLRLLSKYETPEWRGWILGIASAEIEEILSPSLFAIEAYVQAMYSWFKQNFEWQTSSLTPEEKEIQIFIAIHRGLPKSDEARIRYSLLKLYYPTWERATEELVDRVIGDIFRTREQIEKQLSFPNQTRLYRFVKKHTAPFLILQNIIEEDPLGAGKILADPTQLEAKIQEVCYQRYAQISQEVRRGITKSIIYIFVTKIIFALLVEFPYEVLVLKKIHYLPLTINVALPPFLMFLVGLATPKPNEANTQRIVERIKDFVYPRKDGGKTIFSLDLSSRGKLMGQVFLLLYGLLFLLTFGGIAFFLAQLGFNPVSAAIFFVFLSLVLLFGFRVRFLASELLVTGEKESLFSHLLANLTLPLLNLGVWLSQGLAKLNFLVVLLDSLVEGPLKSIIEVVEEWTTFIREKREEVVEVPEP